MSIATVILSNSNLVGNYSYVTPEFMDQYRMKLYNLEEKCSTGSHDLT